MAQPPEPVSTFESPDDVLEVLSMRHREIPFAALAAADVHRDALIEPLLEALDEVLEDVYQPLEEDLQLLSYGLYLLAKWEEPRALPFAIELFALPGDLPFDLLGDIPTENGPAILAALSGGRIETLDELIRDQDANDFGRAAALQAVAALGVQGRVPLAEVERYFEQLIASGLERESSHIWDSVCATCVELGFVSTVPGLREAFAQDWIDPQYIRLEDLDAMEGAPARADDLLKRAEYRPITDVGQAIAWWGEWTDDYWQRIPATSPKVGRNDPCPCGSGRKYKKCHGA